MSKWKRVKTVPSYNNYSPIQFILHSPYFLIQNTVLSVLFFSFIAKRVYKNNEVCIPHSYKIDCPRSKDAQASRCCRQALGKNLLTFPARSTFHCMTVSTNRYHQHLT